MTAAFKPYLVVDQPKVDDIEAELRKFRRHLVVYRGLAASSVDNHFRVARTVLRKLGTAFPTHEMIEEYIERIRTSDYSWSHICNVSLAIERYTEYIEDPIKLGRPRKPKRLIKGTLSEAEVAILIDAARDLRERALVALLACSAIRNQELCDLRVRHVDVANNEVMVEGGKGAKDRMVYIPGDCARIMAEYIHDRKLQEDDYLFRTLRGNRPLRPHVVRRTLLRIAARTKTKKHIYPHLLRHSWATNALNKGANIRTIQAQLGHSFIETTMIYAQTRPQRVKAECAIFAPAYV